MGYIVKGEKVSTRARAPRPRRDISPPGGLDATRVSRGPRCRPRAALYERPVRRAGTRRLTIRRGRSTFDYAMYNCTCNTHTTPTEHPTTRDSRIARTSRARSWSSAHIHSPRTSDRIAALPHCHDRTPERRLQGSPRACPRSCREFVCAAGTRFAAGAYRRTCMHAMGHTEASHTHGIERVGHEFVG